ncbi:MAG: DUF5050 domain-containing protein [Lysobacterales bacterium]
MTLLTGLSATPALAGTYVYWVNSNNSIGRANIDGSGVSAQWQYVSNGQVSGLARDTGHLYFPNYEFQSNFRTIGRINSDGSGLNVSFINATAGQGLVWSAAVNNTHIYWSDPGRGTIGRANVDGTGANLDLIQYTVNAAIRSYNIAVDGAHIYWSTDNNWIARANLDGSGVQPNFIPGSDPRAIVANSTHIYWANFATNRIGRANLDGSGVNQNFISTSRPPLGVALDDQYVYWSNYYNLATPNSGSIGRANLDGSGVDNAFISAIEPTQIAVGSDTEGYANGFE